MKRSEDENPRETVPANDGEGIAQGTISGGSHPDKAKPVHEERIGRVKAVVWANQTANGVRHNVMFKQLFKRDGSNSWEQSDSFGRDDLPLVMEVARRAWLWVYAEGQG